MSGFSIYLHQHGVNLFWEVIDSGRVASLDGSARNEEPLVIYPVNGPGSQILMPGDFEGASIHTVWGVWDGPIGPIATLASLYVRKAWEFKAAYSEMPPGWVLPVINFSQASAHSRMTSVAYFLFLHSPEKANWFSGFPSGIL